MLHDPQAARIGGMDRAARRREAAHQNGTACRAHASGRRRATCAAPFRGGTTDLRLEQETLSRQMDAVALQAGGRHERQGHACPRAGSAAGAADPHPAGVLRGPAPGAGYAGVHPDGAGYGRQGNQSHRCGRRAAARCRRQGHGQPPHVPSLGRREPGPLDLAGRRRDRHLSSPVQRPFLPRTS